MKKRLLAMLLVLALAVSVMTIGVSAATPSIELERNHSESGDGWSWNGKTRTLHLKGGVISENGFNIDCDATIDVDEDTAIFSHFVVDGDLTIEGGYELTIFAEDKTAFVVDGDVTLVEANIVSYGNKATFECGEFSAECCDIVSFTDTFVIADDDVDIYDSSVAAYYDISAIFADGEVVIEWGDFYAIGEGPAIYANDDVTVTSCDIELYSYETSAIWARDDISFDDCDLYDELYEDDLDDAEHPYFASPKDVTALYYDEDDELACWIYAEVSITAYEPVFRFITTLADGVAENFKDVSSSDWFSDAVDYVSRKGLMIGTAKGTFSPNATVSNAMAWMILARINDAYTMSEGNWYDAAQSFVVTCGLSNGQNPNGAITREAFITMLFKSNGSYCVRDLGVFADASSISADAVEAMRWAVEEGIIKGVDGKLNPKGYMTRAELAEILMRLG